MESGEVAMATSIFDKDFQSLLDEVRDSGGGTPLTASPADWRDCPIYFLMLDRFNNRLKAPRTRFDDPNFVDFQGGTCRGVKEQLPFFRPALSAIGGDVFLGDSIYNCTDSRPRLHTSRRVRAWCRGRTRSDSGHNRSRRT
jgi:hypothetical protein